MTPRASRRRDACAERRGRCDGCFAAGMPASGEGLAARLNPDRRDEARGLGESAFAEGYGGTQPGAGVPLQLNEKTEGGVRTVPNTCRHRPGSARRAFRTCPGVARRAKTDGGDPASLRLRRGKPKGGGKGGAASAQPTPFDFTDEPRSRGLLPREQKTRPQQMAI